MRYDVIVVGARAAGAATALLLARHGCDVLVVDRGQYGTDTLSTNALMRAGVLQLHRWGLLAELERAATPPIRRAVFHYGDESVVVPIRPADGVDALFAPRRTVLDRILIDAAQRAGARVEYGLTVDDLQWDAEGRISGIVGRDANGRSVAHRSAFTIGADGIHSRVARAVEARTTLTGTVNGGVVMGYFENPGIEGYQWVYQVGSAAGLIPTNDNAVCVFVSTTVDRFRDDLQPDIEAGFYRLLAKTAPAFAPQITPATQTEHLRGHPGLVGYYREPWGPGWALVGDAGYFKDPITAHGISDALRDAELVATATMAALVEPDMEESSFHTYAKTRDRVSHEFFEVTERIAAFDWSLDEIKNHLFALSKAMGPEVDLILEMGRSVSAA